MVYLNYGNYIINKPDNEEVSETTTATGLDYMSKFRNIAFSGDMISHYPISLYDFTQELCNRVLGVEQFGTARADFPNADYMVQGNPFTNGETCATVLGNIAQLCGGFAKIGYDNKLYIKVLDVDGEALDTIDKHQYFNFERNNVYGKVNSVVLKMNENVGGEDTIKEEDVEGETAQVVIANNFFLISEEERELAIDGVFDALFGLEYLPCKFDDYGFPYLESGDKIKIKDTDNVEYTTYILNKTMKYEGAYSGTIEAPAPTKEQQTQIEKLTLSEFRRNTELAVDKINGRITSVIEDTNNNFTRIEENIGGVAVNVQESGGGNLILNSVMFSYDNIQGLHVPNWTITNTSSSRISIGVDDTAKRYGGLAGHSFSLTNNTVTQKITDLSNNIKYTFHCRVNKPNASGSATIMLFPESGHGETHTITISNGTQITNYEKKVLKALTFSNPTYVLQITVNGNYPITFTDLMLTAGEYETQWQQASTEIMNTQVAISTDGVTVKNGSSSTSTYTKITPTEFAGYNGNTKIFWLDGSTTHTKQLESEKEIFMPPIKIVAHNDSSASRKGWAFVQST